MKLVDIKKGETVKVVDLNSVDKLLKRRLTSLGLHEGCSLCMKQKAIFNGPCTLEYCGQLISIRQRDAKNIKVESK